MTKTELEKKNQLGMPPQTANLQLTRLILFDLVIRTNRDLCVRCGMKIETVRDLTIEHIQPWLHNAVELFWDLDNIAFSHRRCNSGARRTGKRSRKPPRTRKEKAENFAKWYAITKNKIAWNARRRERYKAKQDDPVAQPDRAISS